MTDNPGKALRQGKRETTYADPKTQEIIRTFQQFADVRAPHEAEEPILGPSQRAALRELMAEINSFKELKAVGCKPRKTALLWGPPGTGKTTFAHHFAARLGLPLVCVKSESLVSAYLGSTGSNIGKLFDAVQKSEGKVVIFFDEIDAIGTKRMADQGASVERSASLTVLLRRLEQTDAIVMAATNRNDALDPALWRRFHMQVEIGLPGEDERFAILKRYGMPFDVPEEDLDVLVDATHGASPSLLRQLMEGVKRSIVMAPKVGRDLATPLDVYPPVLAGIAPPPGMEVPVLWTPAANDFLKDLSWPWPALQPDRKPEAA